MTPEVGSKGDYAFGVFVLVASVALVVRVVLDLLNGSWGWAVFSVTVLGWVWGPVVLARKAKRS